MSANALLVRPTQEAQVEERTLPKAAISRISAFVSGHRAYMFSQQVTEPDSAESVSLVRPLDWPSTPLNATDSSKVHDNIRVPKASVGQDARGQESGPFVS